MKRRPSRHSLLTATQVLAAATGGTYRPANRNPEWPESIQYGTSIDHAFKEARHCGGDAYDLVSYNALGYETRRLRGISSAEVSRRMKGKRRSAPAL